MISSKILQEVSYSTVLATVVAFLFAFYGPKLSTELPDAVRVVFENNIARFSVMVVIVYLGNHNLQLSLVIAVCIILIMSYVHRYEIKEELTNKIHRDFYTNSPITEPYTNFGDWIKGKRANVANRLSSMTNSRSEMWDAVGAPGLSKWTAKRSNTWKSRAEALDPNAGSGTDAVGEELENFVVGEADTKVDGKPHLGPGGIQNGESEQQEEAQPQPHMLGPGGIQNGESEQQEEAQPHMLGPGGIQNGESEQQEEGQQMLGPGGTQKPTVTEEPESFTDYRIRQLNNIENSVQSVVNTYKMIG